MAGRVEKTGHGAHGPDIDENLARGKLVDIDTLYLVEQIEHPFDRVYVDVAQPGRTGRFGQVAKFLREFARSDEVNFRSVMDRYEHPLAKAASGSVGRQKPGHCHIDYDEQRQAGEKP